MVGPPILATTLPGAAFGLVLSADNIGTVQAIGRLLRLWIYVIWPMGIGRGTDGSRAGNAGRSVTPHHLPCFEGSGGVKDYGIGRRETVTAGVDAVCSPRMVRLWLLTVLLSMAASKVTVRLVVASTLAAFSVGSVPVTIGPWA